MSATTPLKLHLAQKQPASPRARIKAMLDLDVTPERIFVETGIEPAHIRAWIEGRDGPAEVETALTTWLETLEKAAAKQHELPWVETPDSKRMDAFLDQARQMPTIVVIYGAAGGGKTSTAERHKKRLLLERGERTFYFAATRFIRTPSGTLFKLARVVEDDVGCTLTAGAYRLDALAHAITRHLRPGDLIIVDEAQHLEAAALDALRSFHDETKCGIAYMGNTEVFLRIAGKGRRAEFAQLASRCGARLEIKAPAEETLDTVLAAWGVRGSMERRLLHQIGSGPGGLRQMGHVVRGARIASQELNRPFNAELLRDVALDLGLDQ